jgi:hypothetical protein
MTIRSPRPVAKFRQFMIEQLGNDPVEYKVVDIADLASISEDMDLARLSSQQVGDMLRSWAREHQIFQGWVCLENQGNGARGHSKFRVVRKADAINHAYGKPLPEPEERTFTVEPRQPANDVPIPASNGNGNGKVASKKSFTGKILDVKSDGSMLVTNPDGAFSVRPVKW